MKIFYINHNDFPTGFYRCVVPAYYLYKFNLAEVVCRGDMGNDALMGEIEGEFKSSDIIVFYPPTDMGGLMLLDLAKEMDKIVIFEIDDFLQAIPSTNPVKDQWDDSMRERLNFGLRSYGDAITTTNIRLAKQYSQWGKRVYVLPNMIDETSDRWDVEIKEKDYILIGWMGSSSHIGDLEILKEVVPAILEKYDNVRFKFMGARPDWIDDLKCSRQNKWLCLLGYPKEMSQFYNHSMMIQDKWLNIFEYPQEMAQFDIGLITIENNPFNTIGRSDLKFLEYSMFEISSIASNLHPYRDVIRHKKTGFLVDKNETEGWVYYISQLIEDAELRKKIGKNAKEYVLSERTYRDNIHKWAEVYEKEIELKRRH